MSDATLGWAPVVDDDGLPIKYAIRNGEAQIAKAFVGGKARYSLFFAGVMTGQVFDNPGQAREAGERMLGEKVTPKPTQAPRDEAAGVEAIARAREIIAG